MERTPYTRLLEAMRVDPVINKKIVYILQLDPYRRRLVLNNWLEQLRQSNAPQQLLQSLASLFDDKKAKKALTLINKHDTE